MGFWSPISAGATVDHSNTSEKTSGDTTPILSQDWTHAFDAYRNNLNPSGANATQQTGINYATNNLATDNVGVQTRDINADLGAQKSAYNTTAHSIYDPLSTQAARQAASYSSATPQTGAAMSAPYSQLYSQELIDPSLKAYDYGTDRAFSALDARTAGAGAFGNDRSGLGYSDLGAQSSLGRGQLEAGLKTTGLTNAFGYGMQDAGNLLSNNQFNATAANRNAEFNVNAGYAGDAQKMAAGKALTDSITAQTGIDQTYLQNIITADGINWDKAKDLVAAGTITQGQLDEVVNLAGAANGVSFRKTTDTSKTSVGAKVSVG